MLISFHAKQNSVPQSREKYMGRWIALEGVITDEVYVQGVKKKCLNKTGAFKGYAISVKDISILDL